MWLIGTYLVLSDLVVRCPIRYFLRVFRDHLRVIRIRPIFHDHLRVRVAAAPHRIRQPGPAQLHRHDFHGDWNYTLTADHTATRPKEPT